MEIEEVPPLLNHKLLSWNCVFPVIGLFLAQHLAHLLSSCTRDEEEVVSIVTQLLATLHDMELERASRTRKSSRTFVCIPLHVHPFHLMCGIPVGTGGAHGAFTQSHSHDNQSMQLLILVRHSRHQQPLLSLPDYWMMMTLKSCPVRDFLRQRLLLIHSFISSAAGTEGRAE